MKHVKDMVEAANKVVDHMPAAEAKELLGQEGVTFVDIRDIRELNREGRVPGAYHCPRGMLEFWIDLESVYAKEVFRKGGKFVFFCAGGQRSALAAQTAQEMGLERVCHINDGFKGWREAGGPIEQKD